MVFKINSVFLLILAQLGHGNATTVVPYPNLAEMGHACDVVVMATALENFEYIDGETTLYRTRFQIETSLKGALDKNDRFELQSMRRKIGALETTIWGDIRFQKGQSYLLFLVASEHEPFWQPIMLSYGIHQEMSRNGVSYLVPTIETLEIDVAHTSDHKSFEAPAVYEKEKLVNHLINIFTNKSKWKAELSRSNFSADEFYPSLKAAPNHCSYFIFGGLNIRWMDFPETTIHIYSEDNGDYNFSPASAVHAVTENAMETALQGYDGINFTYGGLANFTPNCVNSNAADGNYPAFLNSLGGTRNTLVQYNDPCNQIANLSSCFGTLAWGGMYHLGTNHSFDGTSWATAGYGFVIVNNGVRACYTETDYKTMMIHELTHSLGFGHISDGFGPANMNPDCCIDITDLDRACLDYTYPPPASSNNNNCSQSIINVTNGLISSSGDNEYKAINTITSDATLSAFSTFLFRANSNIDLNSNFTVNDGILFTAEMGPCVE